VSQVVPLDIGPVLQAYRDAAYNNAAAAPTGGALFARFAEESKALRARFAATMSLPYETRERARLDLFPGSDPEAPCLVYLHGGYWQANNREMFAVLGEGVAAHGWSVAIPGYSLAPDVGLRVIIGQIGAALDWLTRHRRQYGLSGPLIVAGSSAGGLMAALSLAHPAVLAGISVSGIFELAPLRDTYLNVKLQLAGTEIRDLSPIRRPVIAKPFVVAYGSLELPAIIASAAGFSALRRAAGAPGPLIEIAEADHFSILNGLRDPDSDLTHAILELRSQMERTHD